MLDSIPQGLGGKKMAGTSRNGVLEVPSGIPTHKPVYSGLEKQTTGTGAKSHCPNIYCVIRIFCHGSGEKLLTENSFNSAVQDMIVTMILMTLIIN